MLSDREIQSFITDGFVAVRSAVSGNVLSSCQHDINKALQETGTDPNDAETWTKPVVRFWCPDTPAFEAAGTSPVLWETYDQLLGEGRHVERRTVGGSIPVRFPSTTDPGDAGWHIDGSFPVEGGYGVNVQCKGRGLLCLFLFSDIEERDAPTEIKVGSHALVPRPLSELGPEGGLFDPKEADNFADIEALPSAFATGSAGDVFVCHPFLVHRATWPHLGTTPRALAQPEIGMKEPFRLDGIGAVAPVERVILDALCR